MDLLIEKTDLEIRLSELGLRVDNINDSSPSLIVDKRSVRGRSGTVYAGAQFETKNIEVRGRLRTDTLREFEELKDTLNGLLMDSEPFYITKMFPTEEDLYRFELPGESFRDLDLTEVEHQPWKYRWLVAPADGHVFSFLGKSSNGLLYDFIFNFNTAMLPYGETKPVDLAIRDGVIPYTGTARINQLEWPFEIELISSAAQVNIDLTINGRRFLYEHSVTIKSGDIMLIKGYETLLNGTNVNNRTNYEHFELVQGNNVFSTTFRGLIKILNYKEFYK